MNKPHSGRPGVSFEIKKVFMAKGYASPKNSIRRTIRNINFIANLLVFNKDERPKVDNILWAKSIFLPEFIIETIERNKISR